MSRWAGEIKKATHSRRTSRASLLFGKPLTFSVVPISFRDKKMRGWFVCQPRIASPQAGITAIDLKRPLRTHQESSAELRSFSRLASYRELVLSIQSYRWETSFNAWPFPKWFTEKTTVQINPKERSCFIFRLSIADDAMGLFRGKSCLQFQPLFLPLRWFSVCLSETSSQLLLHQKEVWERVKSKSKRFFWD